MKRLEKLFITLITLQSVLIVLTVILILMKFL